MPAPKPSTGGPAPFRIEDIEARLSELGDERAVAVLRKLGYEGPAYGVGITKLKKLGKEIGRNPTLARQLWASPVYESKLLALFVADPKATSWEELEAMAGEIPGVDVLWQFPKMLAAKTPHADRAAREWIDRPEEMVRAAGYHLVGILAAGTTAGSRSPAGTTHDTLFTDTLTRIEIEIAGAPNWVREAMLYAIIGIAKRGAALHVRAAEVWKRIGPVQIDYGPTRCKPPDVARALSSS